MVAVPPGEPDELDVVGEALDLELGEEAAGHLPVEQLETALGVAQAPHSRHPDDEVEDPPHGLAVEGLMLEDLGLRNRAAPEHHLGLRQMGPKLFEILDGG